MKNRSGILFLFLLLSLALTAQDIPDPMKPYRLVNDFADLFSLNQREVLETKLRNYNDSTSTQIYVVTVNDLGGYAVSDYTFALGDRWEIGQSGKDNGVVILVKPKHGSSRGQVYIATGYGIESYITDAAAGRIARNEMLPYFKQENYYQGVDAAVDAIIGYLAGKYDADSDDLGIPVWVIVLIFLAIFILFSSGSGGDHNVTRRGHHRSGGGPIVIRPVRGSGSIGGGRSFGGGGGGSFGGGGAGASW